MLASLKAKEAQLTVVSRHLEGSRLQCCNITATKGLLTLWVQLLDQDFDDCGIVNSNTLPWNPVYGK
jgi:hypothetical protein